MVQVKHDSLKLNGTHQLLVYADNVNIFDGRLRTIEEKTAASVVASKEVSQLAAAVSFLLQLFFTAETVMCLTFTLMNTRSDNVVNWL